jgi:hypothetical protein
MTQETTIEFCPECSILHCDAQAIFPADYASGVRLTSLDFRIIHDDGIHRHTFGDEVRSTIKMWKLFNTPLSTSDRDVDIFDEVPLIAGCPSCEETHFYNEGHYIDGRCAFDFHDGDYSDIASEGLE